MKNRVYGIIGVKAINSNFNADFTGNPRDMNGVIISTDKALKFMHRRLWDNEGKSVFALRSYNENLNPRSLKERYEFLYGELEKKNPTDVLNNLFESVDIKNFGITFAEAGYNFSVTGAVQISTGINLYEDTHVEVMEILSPYRNPNNKKDGAERNQTTIGQQVRADEVHYYFPFSINPKSYDEFGEIKDFSGYDRESFESFKDASRLSVTAFNSNTRSGCDNEFALFVELKENSKTYFPNLVDYIHFTKGEDKNLIDITNMCFINGSIDEIESIEIYYDPYTTDIKEDFKKEKVKKFNIFTAQEV